MEEGYDDLFSHRTHYMDTASELESGRAGEIDCMNPILNMFALR